MFHPALQTSQNLFLPLSLSLSLSLALRPNSGLLCLVLGLLNHTQLDMRTHNRQDSSERVLNPSQRALPTQQTQKTKLYALGGIRTRDTSNEKAADLRPSRTATGIGW